MNKHKKIIFSGGGTLGSVVPLLAIYQELLRQGLPNNNFLWVGTITGPEKDFIEKYKIKYKTVNSGKLRRYFSWQNFLDILYLLIGFIESLVIIAEFRPDLIISAGGFVSVPMVWAARFFGKKIIIHQQDIQPGLANKIMAPVADKITVTFEKSLKDFDESKTLWVGNPVREEIKITNNQEPKTKNYSYFDIKENKPVLLVLGGGTGAMSLNKIVIKALPILIKNCQVIHLTGKGKAMNNENLADYHYYEFLDKELPGIMKLADVVISRAGMSALTELSYFAKPTIVIPIPDSHQEENAKYFADKEAVIYLKQKELTSEKLIQVVNELINNKEKRETLGKNFNEAMRVGANEAIVDLLNCLI